MRNLIKSTMEVAAVAAGIWAVEKFGLDKKLKSEWENKKYAQGPVNQSDDEFDYGDMAE